MCSHPSHNLFKLVRSFIPMEMKIYTLNIKKQVAGTMTFMSARDTKKKKKKLDVKLKALTIAKL